MAGAARSATSTSLATGRTRWPRRTNQSGIDSWRVAVVLAFDGKDIADRPCRRHAPALFRSRSFHWARKELTQRHCGRVARQAGGCAEARRRRLCRAGRGQVGRITACARCPKSTAASSRWIRIPAACWRCPAASPTRSSQFDRAMQAMRQPGSSFKPFVYAAALDNGYTPVEQGAGRAVRDGSRARAGRLAAGQLRESNFSA